MTTWYRFGLTPSDWTFTAAVDGITPNFVPSAVLTAWNDPTAGTQLDISLDSAGSSIVSSITSSDGTDGLPPGTVGAHWVAQATYWIDGAAGAGPRTLMVTTDAADLSVAAALAASNNLDAITNLNSLTASMPLFNVAVAGVYPSRPAAAGTRVVIWIGPSAPGTSTGGAVEGDIWWDTVP